MRQYNSISALVLVLLSFGAKGVPAEGQQELVGTRDVQTFERVEELSEHLQFSSSDPQKDRLYSELDARTQALVAELDKYVEQAFTPDEGSERLQARLRAVLALHVPDAEVGDLALVRLVDLPTGTSLVLAYTIVRGAHHDLATIRGYRWDGDSFRFVASAGGDFEGYGMFKAILPSPLSTEVWLLAWGRARTFNGNKVRIRVYAFDGEAFTSMWNPEDVFNARVRTREDGFLVDHVLLTPHQYQRIHDEYVLGVDGPVKAN